MDDKENLKAENDFLKMKIMLEHGAQFHSPDDPDSEIDPEVENQFLNHIIEFEKQFQQSKTITVIDKIGKPSHFKPVHEIPDDEIENAWNSLSDYLDQYNINLSACSPRVTNKELYRFTTEELFKHEVNEINIPGMMHGFIYDEFYPDYEYENTNCAVDDCIKQVLCKDPLDYIPMNQKDNIRLNNYLNFSEENFKEIVNRFKYYFDVIQLKEIKNIVCTFENDNCKVTGKHETLLVFENIPVTANGSWMVESKWNGDFWVIVNIQIEGIPL